MYDNRLAGHIIPAFAKNPKLELAYTVHAQERIEERGIITSDVKHILQYGRLYEIQEETTQPEETSRPGYYKYKMCSKTPNSDNREICVIVICNIFSRKKPSVKIVTVMWKEEKMRKDET